MLRITKISTYLCVFCPNHKVWQPVQKCSNCSTVNIFDSDMKLFVECTHAEAPKFHEPLVLPLKYISEKQRQRNIEHAKNLRLEDKP